MDHYTIDPTDIPPVEPDDLAATDTQGHSMAYARFVGSRQGAPESERQRVAKRMADETLPPLTKRFPKLRDPKNA
jgi:hypothetical protein